MLIEELSYTIYAGLTDQKGYGSQEDYFDKTMYEVNMMETPLNDYSNTFNQLYSLYHFFAEQKLKEDNLDSKFIEGRIVTQRYGGDKAQSLKDKQCRATFSQQLKVFGYEIDESTITQVSENVITVGFVNAEGNSIGTLTSDTSTGSAVYETANFGTKAAQNTVGPKAIISLKQQMVGELKGQGYENVMFNFKRNRPEGSPLPNSKERTVKQ